VHEKHSHKSVTFSTSKYKAKIVRAEPMSSSTADRDCVHHTANVTNSVLYLEKARSWFEW